MGIVNVDFNATDELLIIYSAFVKYLRKNGNTMKLFIDFKKAYNSICRAVFYNILNEFGIPVKNSKANKSVSE